MVYWIREDYGMIKRIGKTKFRILNARWRTDVILENIGFGHNLAADCLIFVKFCMKTQNLTVMMVLKPFKLWKFKMPDHYIVVSQRLLPYLQLLVSADSEVALVLGVLCPQPVDYLIQCCYIGLPLVSLTSLLAMTSYLVVSERNRLRSRQLRRCSRKWSRCRLG